jgi:N-acetyl-gamma-glutamyl-phosphate reductase
MLVTGYASLTKEASAEELLELYKEYYKGEYFVRILNKGVYPETKSVAGSNFIDIGIATDKETGRVIVLSAIDNIGKGAYERFCFG